MKNNEQKSLTSRQKLDLLRQELNQIFLERANIIDGLLAVLLTRGNAVLFGPPGTAKSWMLKEICGAIENAQFFDRLLHPAITPDEILGQPSLAAMRDKDELIRNTNYRLPQAHIAFLDEVFRGNATSLNALLRLINERIFENPHPEFVPLMFLCGAANQVPTDGDLDAFVDRFVYRPWLKYVSKVGSKRELINRARSNLRPYVTVKLTISEIADLQQQASNIPYPDELVDKLVEVVVALDREGFSVSDRKMQQLVKLLQAHAFVLGDERVCSESFHDLLPDCLWQREPKDRTKIGQILEKIVPDVNQQATLLYDAAKEELAKVETAARGYNLKSDRQTERKLLDAADDAALRLEDIARKIEKLIAENRGKNVRKAQRILADVREELLVEVGKCKNLVYV